MTDQPASLPRPGKSPIESWRIPLTLLLAPLWLLLLLATRPREFESNLYEIIEMGGFFLVFVAVLGRLWCTVFIGGRKDRELCTTGPYSLSRNPLYFASFLGVVGVCLAAQNLMLTIATSIVFLTYYHLIMTKEEVRLEKLFGDEYRAWANSVPRFFPLLKRPVVQELVVVHTRVFTRSVTEVAWFLFAIIGVEIIENMRKTILTSGWILPY